NAAARVRSTRHHAEGAIDCAQHAFELVSAAHDETGGRDHAVRTLPARQLGRFFDAVDGNFRRAPKHGKHGAILEEIDRVVPPLAGSDLAAVKAEDAIELAPIEAHAVRRGGGRSGGGLAPMDLTRVSIAVTHATPPPRDGSMRVMIARETHGGKCRCLVAGATRSSDNMTSVPHKVVKGNIMLPDCLHAPWIDPVSELLPALRPGSPSASRSYRPAQG